MPRHRLIGFGFAVATLLSAAVLLNCEDETTNGPTSTPDSGFGFDGSSGNDSGPGTTSDSATDSANQTTDAGDAAVDAGPAIPSIYGLDDTGKLIRFKSDAPGALTLNVTITGLKAGDALIGIDFRPVTGQLYGVGKLGHLYTLNTTTGAATVINDTAFTPAPDGTFFGVDINPVVDRIRLQSDTEQNIRIHPADAAVVVDTPLTYAPNDINQGQTPLISGLAYTNNVNPAPTTTTLYGIDTKLNTLVTVNPPNAGLINTVGALNVDPTDVAGFDITGGGDGGAQDRPMKAFAALVITNAQPELYTINLQTGAATKVGDIGHNAVLIGLAIEP